MAVKIRGNNGKMITLLNPSEKGEKFADELRNGIRYTNEGRYKVDKNGTVLGLTPEQRAYRAGYLAHSRDSAKAWKHNKQKSPKKRK